MDEVALASVLSSGLVAALTLITVASMRRGDRNYVIDIEFKRRTWETKRRALLGLIETCDEIRSAIRVGEPASGTEAFRQLRVFRVLNVEKSVVTPELIAYASDSVTSPATVLRNEIDRVMRSNARLLGSVMDEQLADARYAKEEAIDHEDFELAARHRADELTLLSELGEATGLDLDHVDHLCESIITAARADLLR